MHSKDCGGFEASPEEEARGHSLQRTPGLRAQRGQSETIHHGVLDKVTLADRGSIKMTITNSLRTIVPTVSEEIHKYDVYQQKNLPLDTEPG